MTLKLKLSPAVSFRVYDEFDLLEKLDDGSFIIELRMPKADWLYSYIFSFGEHCEVLEPEEVRRAVKDMLEKSLKQYL